MNENLQKGDSVFFIELDKIDVNPYQPRVAFDENKLNALADSIKQYGVLQPIVVTRKEEYSEEFGIKTRYQIIAGERRFRASKIAGLNQIPAIIRTGEHTDAEKLELAIIENLQREDLNPVDKAKAFKKLADSFGLTHAEIAKKMGKSREYVSNAMRILMLPENILAGLTAGKISEGHTRSLLMLKDRPSEQEELYRRILEDKLTVRAAEKIARSVATDKIRKKVDIDPEIKSIESHIREKLGTKVTIDQKPIGEGGRLTIEYFSKEDLKKILAVIESDEKMTASLPTNTFVNEEENSDNSFEDIQPTILKEEIDKIEQFGNVGGTEKPNFVQGEKSVVNEPIPASVSEENIENDLAQSIEKLAQDLVDNWGATNDDKLLSEDNSENTPSAEAGVEDNFVGFQIGEGAEDTNVQKEDVGGLERVEVKNDFDRTRIDSFKKTEDILKSFGVAEAPKIAEIPKVQDNDFGSELQEQKENMIAESLDATVNEGNSVIAGYSNLYDEFLKAKNERENAVESQEEVKKDGVVENTGEAANLNYEINNFGEINVKKEEEQPVNNFITGTERNPFVKDETIKAEVLSGEVNDFLADANAKSGADEEEGDNENVADADNGENPDDLYNFKGFSL